MSKHTIRKFVNPEIVYGIGALNLAGQYARTYEADRVMVVTDKGVIAAGWADKVTKCLREAGIDSVVFSDVSPNPRDHEVMAGAELYRTSMCNAIVTVGDGSPMDCAKGIAIVATNHCHILEVEGVDKVVFPMPPLICIPTTAGTSADVSQFAIINNTAEKVKIAIVSKSTVPDVALIDPQTTTSMPPYLTACTGMDALTHAIEEPQNLEYRDGMMLASMEAGLAFSNASLCAVHAMAHSLGGLLDLPHGECNALLLEHVIRYNYPNASGRYRDVAAALGLDISGRADEACLEALTSCIRSMRISTGITRSIREAGVSDQIIPSMAAKAMKDACMVTNPRRPTQQDIEGIYANAA